MVKEIFQPTPDNLAAEQIYVDHVAAIERGIDLALMEPGVSDNISLTRTLESIRRHAEELRKEMPQK